MLVGDCKLTASYFRFIAKIEEARCASLVDTETVVSSPLERTPRTDLEYSPKAYNSQNPSKS